MKDPKQKKGQHGRLRYIPSKDHINAIYLLAKKGLNYDEMAAALKISHVTFRKNLETKISENDEHELFSFIEAIKKGRSETDPVRLEQAKNAFFERVIGKHYNEESEEKIVNSDGEIITKKKTVGKWLPPDVTAGMFYLVNKSGGEFRSINQPNIQLGENTDEYYSKIADTFAQLDNNTKKVQE